MKSRECWKSWSEERLHRAAFDAYESGDEIWKLETLSGSMVESENTLRDAIDAARQSSPDREET